MFHRSGRDDRVRFGDFISGYPLRRRVAEEERGTTVI